MIGSQNCLSLDGESDAGATKHNKHKKLTGSAKLTVGQGEVQCKEPQLNFRVSKLIKTFQTVNACIQLKNDFTKRRRPNDCVQNIDKCPEIKVHETRN